MSDQDFDLEKFEREELSALKDFQHDGVLSGEVEKLIEAFESAMAALREMKKSEEELHKFLDPIDEENQWLKIALKKERERCAKICDGQISEDVFKDGCDHSEAWNDVCKIIAEEIRSGK